MGIKMSYRNDDYGYGCCGILTSILIIAASFVAALGAILGAVFSAFVTENLAVFIVFAVVMFILFVLL